MDNAGRFVRLNSPSFEKAGGGTEPPKKKKKLTALDCLEKTDLEQHVKPFLSLTGLSISEFISKSKQEEEKRAPNFTWKPAFCFLP